MYRILAALLLAAPGLAAETPPAARGPMKPQAAPTRPLGEVAPGRLKGVTVNPPFRITARDYLFCHAAVCGWDGRIGVRPSDDMMIMVTKLSPSKTTYAPYAEPVTIQVSKTRSFAATVFETVDVAGETAQTKQINWLPVLQRRASEMKLTAPAGQRATYYLRVGKGDAFSNVIEVVVDGGPAPIG